MTKESKDKRPSYLEIINQARAKTENINTSRSENNNSVITENQKNAIPENTLLYKQLPEFSKEIIPEDQNLSIQEGLTTIPENSNSVITENQKEVIPEIKFVNLTIKVHPQRRDYWAIEAKKQRKSMTSAMIEGLVAAFGDVAIAEES